MSPLWCNVVQVQGKYISDKMLPKSLMMTGLTTPIDTAANYGLCALVAFWFDWRVSFWIAAGIMTFMAILWYFTLDDIEKSAKFVETEPILEAETETDSEKAKPKAKLGKALLIGLIIMFTAGAFTQYTRVGLNAWVPSILYEVYNMPSTLSIALTLLLPLLASFSNFILVALERKCKDFLLLSLLFVGVASVSMAVLVACYDLSSVVITLVCFIIVTMCCAAIANITTNHIPLYYRDRFDTGSLAGIGQGMCYIGSTLSTYTLGLVADKGGWYNVFLLLGAVIIFSCVMCAVAKIFTREHSHHHPRYKFH